MSLSAKYNSLSIHICISSCSNELCDTRECALNIWIKLSLYETERDEIDENFANHLATAGESDLLTND